MRITQKFMTVVLLRNDIFFYDELNEKSKEKAYREALWYIEAEYSSSPEILKDKHKHAQIEAESCAVYAEDGTFWTLIPDI